MVQGETNRVVVRDRLPIRFSFTGFEETFLQDFIGGTSPKGLQALWAGQYESPSFFPLQHFLVLSSVTFPSNRSDASINMGNIGLMGMLKKASSGVLAFLPWARTESTLRAS